MTLEKFYEVAAKDLQAFIDHWREESQADPESYSPEMDEEDWVEQYATWRDQP